MRPQPTTYGPVTQAIHWTSALLILSMLPLGLVMTRIVEGAAQQSMYRAHVSIGLIVLALTALRLVWRLVEPWAPPPPGLSALREKVFKWTHILLYVAVISMVTSGVAMLLSSDVSVLPTRVVPADIQDVPPRASHRFLSQVFIALLALHIGGVMQYQLRKGDVLSRMGVPWFKPRAGGAE